MTVVDDNSFQLSQVGQSYDKEFFYRTKQYLNFESQGDGLHSFNYPDISVAVYWVILAFHQSVLRNLDLKLDQYSEVRFNLYIYAKGSNLFRSNTKLQQKTKYYFKSRF